MFVLLGAVGLTNAQDVDRANSLRDQLLGELGLGEIVDQTEDESAAAETPDDETELLPSLNGLVLVPHVDEVSADAIQLEEATVEDRGVGPPAAVTAALEGFLNEPVTLARLSEITNTITDVYKSNDRPVVDAFLPEQNVTTGVIQIVVVEGKVGEIRVEGAEHSSEEYVLRNVRLNPGDPVRESTMQFDLDWLNAQPLRNANLLFERGEEYGETDLIVQVQDVRPLRAHAGFGNTGLDLTGENEWNFGLTKGFLFGTEQLLSYQYTADSEFDGLHSHSGFWWAPLPWRHRIEVIGAHVTSEATIPVDDETDIGVGGASSLIVIDYVIPIEHRPFEMKRLDLRFGFDFKSTNNDLEFGGAQVFDETAEVLQFRMGFEGERDDKFGPMGIGANVVWSPGDLSSSNDDASFSSQRGGSTSDYFYAELTMERLFSLPRNWNLAVSSNAQWSASRLLSSEQILAGGYRTVRGFDENLARGDAGIVSSVELLAPPRAIMGYGELQPIFFYDMGWLTNKDAGGGEPDVTLSSIGVELKYRLGGTAHLRAGYGWHVSDSGVEDVEGDGKFHFGATIHY
ncbi:MAG: ShlB/FhaC/HecB family hemolysin secretion/activation protein [Verrucomicrobiota bacterium]